MLTRHTGCSLHLQLCSGTPSATNPQAKLQQRCSLKLCTPRLHLDLLGTVYRQVTHTCCCCQEQSADWQLTCAVAVDCWHNLFPVHSKVLAPANIGDVLSRTEPELAWGPSAKQPVIPLCLHCSEQSVSSVPTAAPCGHMHCLVTCTA